MKSTLNPQKLFDDITLLSKEELKNLAIITSSRDKLLRQILLVKCAIKTSGKDIDFLRNIIDEALTYERPSEDHCWGYYDDYLHEIKKSILLLDNDLSHSDMKTVLLYLKTKAEDDEIVAEFDECGEWALAIDDIGEHISSLEKAPYN